MARDEPERLTTDWGPSTDYDPDERAWEDAEDEERFGPSPEPVVGEPVVMGQRPGMSVEGQVEEPKSE